MDNPDKRYLSYKDQKDNLKQATLEEVDLSYSDIQEVEAVSAMFYKGDISSKYLLTERQIQAVQTLNNAFNYLLDKYIDQKQNNDNLEAALAEIDEDVSRIIGAEGLLAIIKSARKHTS